MSTGAKCRNFFSMSTIDKNDENIIRITRARILIQATGVTKNIYKTQYTNTTMVNCIFYYNLYVLVLLEFNFNSIVCLEFFT